MGNLSETEWHQVATLMGSNNNTIESLSCILCEYEFILSLIEVQIYHREPTGKTPFYSIN